MNDDYDHEWFRDHEDEILKTQHPMMRWEDE